VKTQSKPKDAMFGAGLADAYGAVTMGAAPLTASGARVIERVNTGAR